MRRMNCIALVLVPLIGASLRAEEPADTPPGTPLTFQQVLNSGDTELQSRMLLQLKAEQAAAARGSARGVHHADLDGRIIALREQIARGRPAGEAVQAGEGGAGRIYFPRIVPPVAPTGTVAIRGTRAPGVSGPADARGSVPSRALASPLEDEADAAARAKFGRPATLTLTAEPLEMALRTLAERSGVPIRVRWKALEATGLGREAPVTVDLQNVPASRILMRMLEAAAGSTTGTRFEIEDGGVTVSSADELSSSRYGLVRVYDVRDLVGGAGFAHLPAHLQAELHSTQVYNLSEVIKAAIEPESWRDNGGTVGSLRVLNGMLIVTQVKRNHVEIEQFLTNLRAFH